VLAAVRWLGFHGCCISRVEAREEREGGGEVFGATIFHFMWGAV